MDELRKKVENNLRFITTICIFFLAVLDSVRLEGCVIVAAYLLSYIIFEFREKRYSDKSLRWINTSVLIGMISYVVQFFIFSLSTQNIIVSIWELTIWKTIIAVSTYMILVFPLVTFGFTIFFNFKNLIKSLNSTPKQL